MNLHCISHHVEIEDTIYDLEFCQMKEKLIIWNYYRISQRHSCPEALNEVCWKIFYLFYKEQRLMCQGYGFFKLLHNKISEANFYDFRIGILVIAHLCLFPSGKVLILTGQEIFAFINFHISYLDFAITKIPFLFQLVMPLVRLCLWNIKPPHRKFSKLLHQHR